VLVNEKRNYKATNVVFCNLGNKPGLTG